MRELDKGFYGIYKASDSYKRKLNSKIRTQYKMASENENSSDNFFYRRY